MAADQHDEAAGDDRTDQVRLGRDDSYPGHDGGYESYDSGIGGLFGSLPEDDPATAPGTVLPDDGPPPASRGTHARQGESPADQVLMAPALIEPGVIEPTMPGPITAGPIATGPIITGAGQAGSGQAGSGPARPGQARSARRRRMKPTPAALSPAAGLTDIIAGGPRGPGGPGGQRAAEPGDALPPALLLPSRRRAPARGWRRTVYRASGGLVRIPASSAEARRRDLAGRARTPVASGHYRVAVLSLKGGVGKTTTVVGLGSTLAAMRGDRVIAIDANPDRGTLADKLTPQTAATVRDLLAERARISRYADVRGFTSQALSRLEVLASAQDPAASVPFGEQDYTDACAVLERYYSICITDCGTGLLHSAMAGVLRLADQLVLVSSGSVDGARSTAACLDWLVAHGHQDLVRNGVVVITAARRRGRADLDPGLLHEHFATRCRAVTSVPYDPYLAQGAEVELDQMRRGTATAFLELAALVGDDFGRRRSEVRARPPAG